MVDGAPRAVERAARNRARGIVRVGTVERVVGAADVADDAPLEVAELRPGKGVLRLEPRRLEIEAARGAVVAQEVRRLRAAEQRRHRERVVRVRPLSTLRRGERVAERGVELCASEE